MLLASAEAANWGHLCRCGEALLPVPETLAMLHTGAMWILHIHQILLWALQWQIGHVHVSKWAAGLLGYRFFVLFCFYCNENTPAIISVFVPYSYLLATFSSSANLNPLDVALHHRSVSNILVTVHDTCFCLFVMVFYRSCFTNQHRR